jgi:hypothetical protein
VIALLTRRARAQWPLLVCLLVVLTLGATLLGTCALLVTRTSERTVEVAASRAAPDDVVVTAYTVAIPAANAQSVATDTRTLLTSSIAPFASTTSTRASSVMRALPAASDRDRGLLSEAYLSGVEGLQSRAGLSAGRWPRPAAHGARGGAPLEAALLDNTARLLGLKVGSRVHIGAELRPDPAPPLDVIVVGLVHPLPDADWDRDPLHGNGFEPDPVDASYAPDVNAYGPFLVDLDDLLASGSALDRLEVVAHPDLGAPTGPELDQLAGRIIGADRRLAGLLGDRVHIESLSSPLPQTLLDVRSQQQLVASSVLALALIGILLTALALALAGRLTIGVRTDESALLTSLGTSRGQFAAIAAIEAATLAVLAAAFAVPASSLLHSTLTRLPPLSQAGLASHPVLSVAQVLAVAGGALALAVLQIGLAVRSVAGSGDRRRSREFLARSGADLVLVALAAVGWWQLRAQPAAAGSRADTVRVLAPALLLIAGTALTLRLLPPVLRQAERLAERARGLVLPLAAFQAARRPQSYAAGPLVGLACAAATFGVAFTATWDVSQHDQADMAVGTDLVLTLDAPPVAGQSAAIGAATGGTIGPATQRNIAVGQWLGGPGGAPRLVAFDTRRTSELVRGRAEGDHDWVAVAKRLTPEATVTGPVLARGATLTFTGTAAGESPLLVTPRLLLQDDTGLRTACTGPPVVLDGRPTRVPGCVPIAGLRLVAVELPVIGPPKRPPATMVVTMTLPGASASPAAWRARPASPEARQFVKPAVTVSGQQLRFSALVRFSDPADLTRVLVATTMPDPGAVPIALSSRLAADVNAGPGSRLSLGFASTAVDAIVTEVVPTIPSAPGAPAALADVDALSRALVLRGDLDSPVNAWWAGNPRADAVANVGALHLGKTMTRTGETERLTGSPLRASLPAVLRALVVAAALLLLGGIVLHTAYDVQLRALEVARLRGLGMSRHDIRATLLAEHAAVFLPLLLAGAAVGAAGSRVVAPLLIRSEVGAAPVPAATAVWPWAAEGVLLGLLVAGSALAIAAVVTVQTRRADAAHLRITS